MSKKRLSAKAVSHIATERMTRLADLSEIAFREGRRDRATRYVSLIRSISQRTKTEIPEQFRYCDGCLMPLVPGMNCRTRLRNHHLVTTCECGRMMRMPYIKEQRE